MRGFGCGGESGKREREREGVRKLWGSEDYSRERRMGTERK